MYNSSFFNSTVRLTNDIKFTEEEGAEEHCQGGAPALSNQRKFDW